MLWTERRLFCEHISRCILLVKDYLSSSPLYSAVHLRRRFRVPLQLLRVLERDLSAVEPSLQQKFDATRLSEPEPWKKFWYLFDGLRMFHLSLCSMTRHE